MPPKGTTMKTPSTLFIGSDHGGYELKEYIRSHLSAKYTIIDVGCYTEERVDYPDIAAEVTKAVLSTPLSKGILICGTGIGISIKANRYPGIRAALVYSAFAAEMAKAHNDANILCFGGRTTSPEDALAYIEIWENTAYEGGRHTLRLQKLDVAI